MSGTTQHGGRMTCNKLVTPTYTHDEHINPIFPYRVGLIGKVGSNKVGAGAGDGSVCGASIADGFGLGVI